MLRCINVIHDVLLIRWLVLRWELQLNPTTDESTLLRTEVPVMRVVGLAALGIPALLLCDAVYKARTGRMTQRTTGPSG